MRRFWTIILGNLAAVALATAVYAAGSLTLLSAGSAGTTPASLTYIGTGSFYSVGSTPPWTVSGISIGAADPTRIVIAGIGFATGGNHTAPSVTIGGVSAALATGCSTPTNRRQDIGFYYLAVPTGTTTNIVVSSSDNQSNMPLLVAIWSLTNSQSATPVSGASSCSALAGSTSQNTASFSTQNDGFVTTFMYGNLSGTQTITSAGTTRFSNVNVSQGTITGSDFNTAGANYQATATYSATRTFGVTSASWY